ncbi:helix-turn-helix domain-containing protein [Rhizobium mesoamericanum]|uniref:Putative two-component response regulator protein n=1 Tax=Rhizobium mesoamericanum STM3625 TaxID=1211777 RepID=K0Q5G2_9HYPH|nr:helix-turn-helix domain-containing protein [Rhizobium mesoamericanum]CCM78489.1 putative two-component response regulator protein [Rhizobium mesoamericanum STM3625]
MTTALGELEGKVVLVVEDEFALASDLASKLAEIGVNTIGPAPSVERALAHIEGSSRIDAAILDINLGGVMVFPVADELLKRNIPFYFATGYSRDVVPPRFADQIFVEKPFDKKAIYGALTACRSSVKKVSRAQKNLVLSALSIREHGFIRPFLKPVQLNKGEVLEQQFEEIRTIFFIETGVVSVIASSLGGSQVEVGLIGHEGVTGTGLLEGDWSTPYKLMVQIEGTAQCIDVDSFLRLTHRAPQLRSLLSSFSRSFAIQISYTALASSLYTIEQRLARLLLMLDDRSDGHVLQLTQDQLSAMLGVRRAGVTTALPFLEGEKLIRSVRGKVIVVDRDGLMLKANGSYGIPEMEYERLMGFPARSTEELGKKVERE